MLALNSTFCPFPSSVEGISEHLMTLSQAQFSYETQNKIETIIKNQPEFVEGITKIFGKPVEQITIVDDFDEVSNSFSLKICFVFTTLADYFVSNVLAMLFILYDKCGEDSMKRSMYNRLNSQFAYPVIISNLLSRPAWTWRVIFGPISSTAADAAVLIGKGHKYRNRYNIIDYGHQKMFLCIFSKTQEVSGR
jgi:hypothetical protein